MIDLRLIYLWLMLREYSEHTFYILNWEQLVKAQQYLRDYVFSVSSYISGQEIKPCLVFWLIDVLYFNDEYFNDE